MVQYIRLKCIRTLIGDCIMNLMNVVSINIYSILFLVVIYGHSIKFDDKVSLSSKLYMMIVRVTIFLLFVDIFSRFDGRPDTLYEVFNHTGNFLIFIFSPILPTLWLMYVHLQVYQDEQKTIRLFIPAAIINVGHGVLVVLSLYTGWLYSIDADNIYHRGPLFLVSAATSFSLLMIAYGIIVFNRKKTQNRYYFSLMFFVIPPLISIFLQITFYGTSLVLNGVVLSLLIIFLNIQNQSIYTDHLTGVYNRKMLDKYLKTKVAKSTQQKTFSAIMLDLNDFKLINDTYGHDMGDDALQTAARMLKNSIKANDFIARFGGDEFWLVLNASKHSDLKQTVKKINHNLTKLNSSSELPYKLSFSMGYAVYNYDEHMSVEAFEKYIDELMYENKQSK